MSLKDRLRNKTARDEVVAPEPHKVKLKLNKIATDIAKDVAAAPKNPLVKTKKLALPTTPAALEQAEEDSEWIIRNQQGDKITLDKDQRTAVKYAVDGKSFCMIGKAGTGKTTTVQAIILRLMEEHAHKIKDIQYRIKGQASFVDAPSIAVVAYANKAANNIRNKIQSHPDLGDSMGFNVTTLHNLLEYSMEFYEAITDSGESVTKMRYFPKRDQIHPLEITHLIVEESSMVGVGDHSIWQELYDAMPYGCQVIFLGDINQLPPVGGKAVLSYAVNHLDVVELRTVHRQALDNPIIRQALNCLSGDPIVQDYDRTTERGVRVFSGQNTQTKLPAYKFKIGAERLIQRLIEADQFDPLEDIILCPFNKTGENVVGTREFNAELANYLAKRECREVWEIKAGYNTVYLSVGDRVMIDKYEGVVSAIRINGSYIGKAPKAPSVNMDYFGHCIEPETELKVADEDIVSQYNYGGVDIDLMATKISAEEEGEKTRAASAVVTVQLVEKDQEVVLDRAGHFGEAVFSLGYALSVHKAQGSEWPRVVLVLHDSHSMLLFRELVYTGMTRPRDRLDIIAQPHVLDKAINSPRIKGDTLAAKLEFFNSGYLDLKVPLTKDRDNAQD